MEASFHIGQSVTWHMVKPDWLKPKPKCVRRMTASHTGQWEVVAVASHDYEDSLDTQRPQHSSRVATGCKGHLSATWRRVGEMRDHLRQVIAKRDCLR